LRNLKKELNSEAIVTSLVLTFSFIFNPTLEILEYV